MPASHTAAQKSRVAGERTGGAGRGRRRDRAADEPRRLRPPSRLTPVLPSSRRPGLRVRLRAGRRGAGCSRPPMPPSGLRGQAGHAGRSLEPRKDLAVVSRLLPPKLVARKAQHDQAGGLQLLLERVQLCRGNSEGGRGAPGLEGPLRTERAQATPVPARGAHRAALEPPSQGRAAPSASSGAARRGPWAEPRCSTLTPARRPCSSEGGDCPTDAARLPALLGAASACKSAASSQAALRLPSAPSGSFLSLTPTSWTTLWALCLRRPLRLGSSSWRLGPLLSTL